MKNLLILFLLTLLTGFNLSAQNGGACVFMLPDSTVICYTTGNSGNPNINSCQSDAAAAGAIPMDCLTSPFVSCASWYVSDGISCFFGGTGNCASGSPCDVLTLPIELYKFWGSATDKYNEIFWTTASETNNDYFIISHSIDGVNFTDISEIDGAGNTNVERKYRLIHTDVSRGINYYKLKQVDYNGEFKEYYTISINNNGIESSDLFSYIYPNPSSDLFYFHYNGNLFNSPILVEILDFNGKTIHSGLVENFNSSQGISFKLSNISKGVYRVKLTQNTNQEIKKIVII